MKLNLRWVLILILCTFAHGQEVEITAEPSHHQILENAYVRVFKVEIPPHAATLMHRHRHDYFFVALAPTTLSNEVAGKPASTIKIQQGEVRFAEGNFAHVARNLTDQPFPHVTIEFLKDAEAHKTPPPKWDEERALHVHMNGTQDVLFVKDGVRVSDFELQPGGMVHKLHHAGPRLIIAVSDIDIKSSVTGKGSMSIQLKSGEVMWLKGGTTDMLMNAGRNPARWITLEFQ
jgi:quercetin dioxygenase-like cupin family protein